MLSPSIDFQVGTSQILLVCCRFLEKENNQSLSVVTVITLYFNILHHPLSAYCYMSCILHIPWNVVKYTTHTKEESKVNRFTAQYINGWTWQKRWTLKLGSSINQDKVFLITSFRFHVCHLRFLKKCLNFEITKRLRHVSI